MLPGGAFNDGNLTKGYTIGGGDSDDLLTTIDGDQSSYFTSAKRYHNMQLEQKEDVIE